MEVGSEDLSDSPKHGFQTANATFLPWKSDQHSFERRRLIELWKYSIAFKPIWTRFLMISWLWCVKFDASGNKIPWNPLWWLPHGIGHGCQRGEVQKEVQGESRDSKWMDIHWLDLVEIETKSAWCVCIRSYQVISGPFASPFAIPDPAQTAGGQVVSAKRSRSGAKAVATCGGKNGSDAAILLDIRSDIRISYPYYVDLSYLLCNIHIPIWGHILRVTYIGARYIRPWMQACCWSLPGWDLSRTHFRVNLDMCIQMPNLDSWKQSVQESPRFVVRGQFAGNLMCLDSKIRTWTADFDPIQRSLDCLTEN